MTLSGQNGLENNKLRYKLINEETIINFLKFGVNVNMNFDVLVEM